MTKKNESSEYLGFARKYRPQDFGEVAGQATVSTTLKNAIADGRPAQAYLFFGPRGVGKTTTARILAKALNCQKGPTAEPCGNCPACVEIAQGNSIDVLELDAATHTQVDKIREMIVETASLTPSRDRYKIFIIDEVHMLSTASFNALLKTLEEPPAHVVFILATTDPGKIPATIVSRCQRFKFRPLPHDVLIEHLGRLAKSEKIAAEPAALDLLARAAGGSLRDAVSLLEQAYAYADGKIQASQVQELLGFLPDDLLMETGRAILDKNAAGLAKAVERVGEEGYDPAHLLRDLRERFHECYLFRLSVGEELGAAWKEFAGPFSAETFSFLVQRLTKALENIRSSDSPRLSLEISLFGMLEPAYDLKEWIVRLESLEKRIAGGAGSGGIRPAAAAPGGDYAPGTGGREQGERPLSQSHADKPAWGKDARPFPAAPSQPEREIGRHPSPAAKPVPAASSNFWPAALEKIRAEKPGLANDLESSRLVAAEGNEWRLVFPRPFEMERAQKNQNLIESTLLEIAGRPVRLKFEVGGSSGEPSPADARQQPRGAAHESGAHSAGHEDPAIKKVLEIFPGKVRQIKK